MHEVPLPGRNGHIAIATGDLEGASALLRRRGVALDETTRTPKAVYLRDEVGGFAIHLVQK